MESHTFGKWNLRNQSCFDNTKLCICTQTDYHGMKCLFIYAALKWPCLNIQCKCQYLELKQKLFVILSSLEELRPKTFRIILLWNTKLKMILVKKDVRDV